MDLNQLLYHHQMALMAVSQAERHGGAAPDFDLPRYYAKRINEYRERRGLNGDAEAIARLSGSMETPAESAAAPEEFVGDILIAELLIAKALERAKHEPGAGEPGGPVDPPVDIRAMLLAAGQDVYRSLGFDDVSLAEESEQRRAWEDEGGSLRPSAPDEEDGITRTYVEQFSVGNYRYSNLVDAKAAARREREAMRLAEMAGS